jgi:16S rRNA (uracil1498-N3)-methyltransferase
MNLLLLRPEEVADRTSVVLTDRRAAHVRDVLRAEPGRRLRCGVLDGPLGEAVVKSVGADSITLSIRLEPTLPPRPTDALLVAAPRPKVLRRLVADATALGFGTIVVFRSWHVDRSHLESRSAAPEALETQMIEGLEQARRTWRPRIVFEPLFRPFVEDRLDEIASPDGRYVAHPTAKDPLAAHPPIGPFTLAIGPERGFTPFEVELLEAQRFRAVHAGHHPLRVETATAALTGQLLALREAARTGAWPAPRPAETFRAEGDSPGCPPQV